MNFLIQENARAIHRQNVTIMRLYYRKSECDNNWELSFKRERINLSISRRIGNLKNTHISAHRRVPRQPYIGAAMYGQRSNVWIGVFQCDTSTFIYTNMFNQYMVQKP